MSVEAERKRTAAIANDAILIAYGPHNIGYDYGGGLSWVDLTPSEMEARFKAKEIWTPDCRATINWVCKQAGWKPFGRYGFEADSAEMWEVLPHFESILDCHAGTLIAYGEGGDAHITQVMQPDGDNPWLMSHGSAFSTNHVRYQDETAYHEARGEYPTLLAVATLLD